MIATGISGNFICDNMMAARFAHQRAKNMKKLLEEATLEALKKEMLQDSLKKETLEEALKEETLEEALKKEALEKEAFEKEALEKALKKEALEEAVHKHRSAYDRVESIFKNWTNYITQRKYSAYCSNQYIIIGCLAFGDNDNYLENPLSDEDIKKVLDLLIQIDLSGCNTIYELQKVIDMAVDKVKSS